MEIIENSINSSERDAGLDDKLSELTEIKTLIEKNFPKEKTIKEYENEIVKLRDNLERKRELLNNPLLKFSFVIDSEDRFFLSIDW